MSELCVNIIQNMCLVAFVRLLFLVQAQTQF